MIFPSSSGLRFAPGWGSTMHSSGGSQTGWLLLLAASGRLLEPASTQLHAKSMQRHGAQHAQHTQWGRHGTDSRTYGSSGYFNVMPGLRLSLKYFSMVVF
jgi:hypothetical protein